MKFLRHDLLYKFMEIAISLKYLEEHVNILPRMDEADTQLFLDQESDFALEVLFQIFHRNDLFMIPNDKNYVVELKAKVQDRPYQENIPGLAMLGIRELDLIFKRKEKFSFGGASNCVTNVMTGTLCADNSNAQMTTMHIPRFDDLPGSMEKSTKFTKYSQETWLPMMQSLMKLLACAVGFPGDSEWSIQRCSPLRRLKMCSELIREFQRTPVWFDKTREKVIDPISLELSPILVDLFSSLVYVQDHDNQCPYAISFEPAEREFLLYIFKLTGVHTVTDLINNNKNLVSQEKQRAWQLLMEGTLQIRSYPDWHWRHYDKLRVKVHKVVQTATSLFLRFGHELLAEMYPQFSKLVVSDSSTNAFWQKMQEKSILDCMQQDVSPGLVGQHFYAWRNNNQFETLQIDAIKDAIQTLNPDALSIAVQDLTVFDLAGLHSPQNFQKLLSNHESALNPLQEVIDAEGEQLDIFYMDGRSFDAMIEKKMELVQILYNQGCHLNALFPMSKQQIGEPVQSGNGDKMPGALMTFLTRWDKKYQSFMDDHSEILDKARQTFMNLGAVTTPDSCFLFERGCFNLQLEELRDTWRDQEVISARKAMVDMMESRSNTSIFADDGIFFASAQHGNVYTERPPQKITMDQVDQRAKFELKLLGRTYISYGMYIHVKPYPPKTYVFIRSLQQLAVVVSHEKNPSTFGVDQVMYTVQLYSTKTNPNPLEKKIQVSNYDVEIRNVMQGERVMVTNPESEFFDKPAMITFYPFDEKLGVYEYKLDVVFSDEEHSLAKTHSFMREDFEHVPIPIGTFVRYTPPYQVMYGVIQSCVLTNNTSFEYQLAIYKPAFQQEVTVDNTSYRIQIKPIPNNSRVQYIENGSPYYGQFGRIEKSNFFSYRTQMYTYDIVLDNEGVLINDVAAHDLQLEELASM